MTLREEYDEKVASLERLATNLKAALEQFFTDAEIDVLSVTYRIKTFESFEEKIGRKKYRRPFVDTPDLCGLRAIVFFPSDLTHIDQIIRAEFKVQEIVNQSTKLHENQFGYRSNHYVVSLKQKWLNAPNYRGLKGLRAEIQVRTILMHAWAKLSRQLAYKSAEQAPVEFRRRIFQLSALFEMADEEFDRLRQQKVELQAALLTSAATSKEGFDLSQPLNLDTLQAYLNYRFPDRAPSEDGTPSLLDEIKLFGITLSRLDAAINATAAAVEEHEPLLFPERNRPAWSQVGAVRHALSLTSEDYWQSQRNTAIDVYRDLVEAYRAAADRRARAF